MLFRLTPVEENRRKQDRAQGAVEFDAGLDISVEDTVIPVVNSEDGIMFSGAPTAGKEGPYSITLLISHWIWASQEGDEAFGVRGFLQLRQSPQG